jgi:hypothetical protein
MVQEKLLEQFDAADYFEIMGCMLSFFNTPITSLTHIFTQRSVNPPARPTTPWRPGHTHAGTRRGEFSMNQRRGITSPSPALTLSWWITSFERGVHQTKHDKTLTENFEHQLPAPV